VCRRDEEDAFCGFRRIKRYVDSVGDKTKGIHTPVDYDPVEYQGVIFSCKSGIIKSWYVKNNAGAGHKNPLYSSSSLLYNT
jgi:hypothetical protein